MTAPATADRRVELHIHARRNISLDEALSALGDAVVDATVLAWGPRRVVIDSVDPALPSRLVEERVFEARIFGPTGELRWLQRNYGDGARLGDAAWLSEQAVGPSDWTIAPSDIPIIETIPRTYLCWGEVDGAGTRSGWTRLTSSRIGPIELPVDAKRGDRVLVEAVEYLGRGEEGNAVIVNERLTGFRTGKGAAR